MKNLLLAFLLALGMASNAWAFNCPRVVNTTTEWACTQTVYNDSGAALVSGSVVIYDNDDTEFDQTGYPYVTTTTTADDDWVAGVVPLSGCASAGFCDIIVYGFAWTRVADSTDAVAEDTLVGTSTVAGQAGDYGTGANTCALGKVTQAIAYPPGNGGDSNSDGQLFPVWVDPDCN